MGMRTGKTYGTPKSVRLMMARLFEEYRLGVSDYELAEIKSMMWMLGQVLSALKVEKDLDVEKRLDELEERVATMPRRTA